VCGLDGHSTLPSRPAILAFRKIEACADHSTVPACGRGPFLIAVYTDSMGAMKQ